MRIMFNTISLLWFKFRQKFLQGRDLRGSEISATATIQSGCVFVNSKIGHHSYAAYNCQINDCEIGSFCSIAPEVVIGAAQHPISWASTSPAFEDIANSAPRKRFAHFPPPQPKRTIIGSDVWIGRRAMIMGGVNVGHGAIIGAGAVVTHDVEPYAIVAGCPARLIRFRFDEETRLTLLESEWWNLTDFQIQSIAESVQSPSQFAVKAKSSDNQIITPPRHWQVTLHAIRLEYADDCFGDLSDERMAA